jgi:hypothetical protein
MNKFNKFNKLNIHIPNSDPSSFIETESKARDDLKILFATFTGVVRGLEELKGTYKADRSILSSIDVIINKIGKIQSEYNELMRRHYSDVQDTQL